MAERGGGGVAGMAGELDALTARELDLLNKGLVQVRMLQRKYSIDILVRQFAKPGKERRLQSLAIGEHPPTD